MLECEGYKMFFGQATVTPKTDKFPVEVIVGTWLYKPEWDCWYVNGQSHHASIVSDFHELNPSAAPMKKREEDIKFLEDCNFER